MLANVIAVIRRENHDRPFAYAALVERIEHFAKLRVHVGNVGKVAVADFGGLLGRERELIRRQATQLATVVKGDLRRTRRTVGIERRQPGSIVLVPISLGGVKWRVRLPEADRQEKRIVLDFA